MRKSLLFFITFLIASASFAQRKVESSAEILHEMQKLKVVGNVLYLAAHPDDENTRLIAWLENEKKVRTAYLSLTRGDGGQNLIGTEKGDALGVLRTQELLEARKEDGGEQFFTRAKDFGYSKTPKETFEKWDKEKVLEDVVWVIRKFQPDVIVTRFPSDGRGGHGHHTASAILAEEAFELAADPNYASHQLREVSTWKTKRLLWNTSIWWDQQIAEKAAKEEDYIKIDIGAYNTLLGLSYSEIAADARSQHKSQGFGSARSRGTLVEYLKHTKGDQAEKDLFEGIDLSWSRIKGGEAIENKINDLISDFDYVKPSNSVKGLLELKELVSAIEDTPYKVQKMKEITDLILKCAGIHLEILAEDFIVSGQDVKCKLEIVNRSKIKANLKSVAAYSQKEVPIDSLLPYNVLSSFDLVASKVYFNGNDHPYWLNPSFLKNGTMAIGTALIYPVAPENERFSFLIKLKVEGHDLEFWQKIDYKWTDRAKGELHRDIYDAPSMTITSTEESYLFNTGKPKTISLIAEAHTNNINGNIQINIPDGWKAEPEEISFELKSKGEKQIIEFQLYPPQKSSEGTISFSLENEKLRSIQRIEYDHIRPQFMFPITKINVVRFVLNGQDKKIAYIEGSGDLVDESLRGVGYQVENFTADELLTADLSSFQTIMVGIRAYNTDDNMRNANKILNDFAEKGGTVIVQYNTSRGLKADQIGPYPLELSRNRVTDEYAAPTLLKPEHPIFNSPNKINHEDFDNWVQERGLYFGGKWGTEYEPLIAWNDEGEDPQKGGLLVANYGNGKFIYTGISFFRQLPAGVPGAYRLLANLIAYGQE